MSNWRVIVEPNQFDGVNIRAANRLPDGTALVPVFTRMEETVLREAVGPVAPTLRLEDGFARALLDALAEHYGNTSGGRQQRADYEHERVERVKLTDAVITLAMRNVS